MSDTQAKVSADSRSARKLAARLFGYLLLAASIGWLLNHFAAAPEKSSRPAGFYRGVFQGALMPAALPNLLIGKDVAIYAQNNTGLSYKLGYTVGVNGCGALFFGFFYWRISRWRKRNES